MNSLEILRQFARIITIADVIWLAGLILVILWVLRTLLGPDSLADSAPRRTNMPVYLPFITLLIWFGIVSLTIPITKTAEKLMPDLADWQSALLANIVIFAGSAGLIAIVIFLAKVHFARGLKGLGLNRKTILKDCFWAVINLIYVWPIVYVVVQVTIFYGHFIFKDSFHWPQHQTLESIVSHPQLPLRILIFITTAAIVPVVEEMLFRGLLQTMIRSYTSSPWLSIVVCSGLFAMVHQYAQHWPALFVLSFCLGYSYEKSGSLFRPILIHSIFNSISIILVLYNT